MNEDINEKGLALKKFMLCKGRHDVCIQNKYKYFQTVEYHWWKLCHHFNWASSTMQQRVCFHLTNILPHPTITLPNLFACLEASNASSVFCLLRVGSLCAFSPFSFYACLLGDLFNSCEFIYLYTGVSSDEICISSFNPAWTPLTHC